MQKIVIGAHRKLEIGRVYRSVYDQHVVLRNGQRYRVVGESTVEEWADSVRSFGGKVFEEQVDLPCPHYYEIQTD